MKKLSQKLKRASSLLRGSFGMCFYLLLLAFTTGISAQNTQVIYSGLVNPTSIYATQDHLFVVESGKHRILKLNYDGDVVATLGGLGSGDYQFDRPIDVDATNGLQIYISDNRNMRVQIYDRRFRYLSSIKTEVPFTNRQMKPTQIVVNDFDELFVFDEVSKSILKFDENGNFVDSFDLEGIIPANLEVDGDRLIITDRLNKQTVILSQNGIIGESFPLIKGEKLLIQQVEFGRFRFKLFADRIEKNLKQ
ncbi:MAG: hypothetical protein NXI08_07115 [bacterium]|nr:hypothetical protein [bacterium]